MIRVRDKHNYILITPIKDEYENLLKLKQTVFNQTIRPKLWVIVDGNSKDESLKIAHKIFKEYKWIYIIKQNQFFEKKYSHRNFAQAVNEGYEYAKSISYNKGIIYSFIGKIDATVILMKDYFEILLSEMEKDPKLAIICGLQVLYYKGKNIYFRPLPSIRFTGFNDIRLYRKEFFENICGYPLTSSPDGNLLIKAVNREWKIKVTNETYHVETRLGGSKIGTWKGMKLKGKAMYTLGYHPILMCLNAFYTSLKFPPYYQGLPMILGYILGVIRRDEKILDEEILQYYGEKRLKDIIHSIFRYSR